MEEANWTLAIYPTAPASPSPEIEAGHSNEADEMSILPPGAGRSGTDFPLVNRAVLPHLEALCARWLPGGKRIGTEWTCGSLRGEAGTSCKVNLRTGRWADFATGEKGGDPVSLTAAIHHLSQHEAAQCLARMFGLEGHT